MEDPPPSRYPMMRSPRGGSIPLIATRICTSLDGSLVRVIVPSNRGLQGPDTSLLLADRNETAVALPLRGVLLAMEVQVKEDLLKARKRIPWKSPPRVLGGSEPAPPPLPKSLSGFLSDEQIYQMDKLSLRQALTVLNLPTSGRIEALRERLKEAQKNASK